MIMTNIGSYEVSASGSLGLRVMTADEWNATQAYLQSHGHAKKIFALLSEEESDDSQESGVASYEC